MIQREDCPASSNAQALEMRRSLSLSQSHQLIGGQSQDAKHQMAHHFGIAPDPQMFAAELILEPRIAAFGNGALVIANGFRRGEFDLLTPARVVVNQGNMAQTPAVVTYFGTAIGGVHHLIEVGHPLCGDQRQGNRGKAVVHRGERQPRGDGHATVGGVDMQLVTIPADFVPMGIALRAAITPGWDVLEPLRQGLLALMLDGRFLGRLSDFATPGTATLSCRRHRGFWRTRWPRGGRRPSAPAPPWRQRHSPAKPARAAVAPRHTTSIP